MNTIIIRSITGLLYASIILSSLYYDSKLFSFIIFIFSCLSTYEYKKLIGMKSFIQYILLGIIFYYFSIKNFNNDLILYILFITLASHIFMLKWLFFKKYKNNLINHFLTYGYMVFGCFFIIAVPFSNGDYNPQLLLFVFLINWFNNSFAYLLGKNFGKNKLLPSVSPNKSWEGFWGGLFFSLIAAFILYKLQIDIRLTHILICSILIPVLATLGDLIQSKIKRDAGVKDSGYILPGHGGFYDRMDSIIFIAPWMFFIFNTF